MACEINIGKFSVDEANVQSALNSVKGVTDFDTAVVKSYTFVKDEVPLGVWEKHLKKVWNEIPKSRKIQEEDLSDFVTPEVTELKEILNMEGEVFTTARGEAESTLTPQAQQAIATWKKHLINRNEKLDHDEVRRVLRALTSVVKIGKRDSRLPKLQSAAKKAVKKKLASSPDAQRVFQKLLGIDFQYIRDFQPEGDYSHAQLVEDYRAIVETLARREAVLTLGEGELKTLIAKANKIIGALGTTAPKIKDIKTDDPTERETLLYQFSKAEVEYSKLPLREERDKAKYIAELTREDLDVLNNREIALLIKGIESINKGLYQGHSTTKILDKIKQDKAQKEMQEVFERTEKTDLINGLRRFSDEISKYFGGNSKTSFFYAFRKAADTYAGTVTGDKNNTLFRNYLSRLAAQDQKVSAEKAGLYDRHDKVSNAIGEDLGRVERIYATSILAFHEQAISNEGQWTAEQLIDSFIDNGLNSNSISRHDIELMEKLKKKYVKDGKLDADKLKKDVFSNKGMKALYEFNKQNGEQLVDKLIVTTATERGEAVPIIVNHAALSTLWTPKAGAVDPTESFAKSLHPSAKSSAAHERMQAAQDKVAPVVDFDLLGVSTRRSAEIVTDYYMTPILKELHNASEKTLENLVKKKAPQLVLNAAKGWKQYVDAEIDNIVARHSENYSLLNEASKVALKAAYTAKLLRGEKVFSETIGNLGWWAIEDPVAWMNGAKSDLVFRKDIALILNNIDSIQQTKLSRSGTWDGKTVDSTWYEDNGRGRNRANNDFEKLTSQAYRAGKPVRLAGTTAEKISDLGLAGPDKITTRPGYAGVLEREFHKLSGLKLTHKEYDLIAANDEAFMDKHGDNLRAAAKIADEVSVRAASTGSSVATMSRFKRDPNDPISAKFYKVASGYLMNFSINEAAAWTHYFRGLVGREEMSRRKAIAGLSAILVRMAAYRPMMTAFAVVLAYMGLSDDDDEKEWSDVWKEFQRDMLGSFLTLTLQGRQGGWERQAISLLVEDVNRKNLWWLRDYEDYNAFEHGLMFTLIRDRDFNGRTSLADILVRFIGPAGAVIKDGNDVWKLFNNKYANTDAVWDEFTEDLILFIAAYTGMLPFYRDIINKRKARRWKEAQARKKKKKRGGRRSTSSKRTSRRRE